MGRSAWYLVRQAAESAALQGKYPRPEQRVAAPHAGAAREGQAKGDETLEKTSASATDE